MCQGVGAMVFSVAPIWFSRHRYGANGVDTDLRCGASLTHNGFLFQFRQDVMFPPLLLLGGDIDRA